MDALWIDGSGINRLVDGYAYEGDAVNFTFTVRSAKNVHYISVINNAQHRKPLQTSSKKHFFFLEQKI